MWSAARPSWHGPGNSGADNTELLFPILQKQVQWNLRPGIAVGPKGVRVGRRDQKQPAGRGAGAQPVWGGACAPGHPLKQGLK